MQQNLGAIKVALRVLAALTEKRAPDQIDVEILRCCASDQASKPIDELACEVIQQALRKSCQRADACQSSV